jgi:hypothetical protein
MATGEFRDVLNWLNNMSLRNIVVYGGEVRIHPKIKEIVKLAKERYLRVEIYTNGYGMSNPKKTVQIISELSEMGVNTLNISTDKDHRIYAEKKGIQIDYEFLGKLFNLLGQKKVLQEHGIQGDISINRSGNDNYAIPVGHARNFSWRRRLESGSWGYNSDLAKSIKRKVKNEFTNWKNTRDYSHPCYCPPARMIRRTDKSNKYNLKTSWTPYVNTDMTVTACPFDVIPRLCSIKEASAEEVFKKANTNILYQTLAYEGPQGVARLVWDISEDKLREKFIERTPCGPCEDLATSNFNDLQEMINTEK